MQKAVFWDSFQIAASIMGVYNEYFACVLFMGHNLTPRLPILAVLFTIDVWGGNQKVHKTLYS